MDDIFSRPVPIVQKAKIQRRQVVQPTWLTNGDFKPLVNGNVRVTDQSLKEAAAIREAIQQAVDTGSFAVDSDHSKSKSTVPIIESSERFAPVQPLFPNFDIPQFDFSQWNFQLLNSEQQKDFSQAMEEIWQQIVESSGKWFQYFTPE